MSLNVNGVSMNSSGTPIGSIVMWPTNSIPAGWLICNGQTVQKSAYPELVEILAGNSTATSASVPDMRGVSPAGAGYCSARGSSGNVVPSPGLNPYETTGSNTSSYSFTPSHTSNSQTIQMYLPRHSHSVLARGSTKAATQGGGRYDATPNVADATDSFCPGLHFFGGPNQVEEWSNVTFTLYTQESGSAGNPSQATINFPGHNTISGTINTVQPVFGINFIIKAKD